MNSIRADVSGSGNGYSLIARWRDPHTLETVGKRGGRVIGSATYAVSVDGQTLTISGDQQMIVLDRANAV